LVAAKDYMGEGLALSESAAESFGWQLRELRKQRHLSIEDLALASGVGVVTISDIERGKTKTPQRSTVRQLAEALDLTDQERTAFDALARRDAAVGGRLHRAPVEPYADAIGAATRTLPYAIRSFVGRAEDLRELTGAITDSGRAGIFLIEGMPGIGKTSLALTAAHQLADGFPDGQLFINLHGYTRGLRPLSAEEALRSLLNCLGMPNEVIPRKLEERERVYRNRLAGTRTLIVLDNAASAAQVRPLLPGAAGCPVIITSRRSLRGLDDAQALLLGTLAEDEAIELFRTVAGPGRVPADAPELADIVRLCEYLPLAIRIIAARMNRRTALAIGDVLDELRGSLERLQDEDRSVTAVFELSVHRLPPPEQRLFRRLGVIPGPDFDVCAAASLVPGDDARLLLDSLLDHNLLIQQIPGRYRFHDLVRVYASSLAAGEHAAAGRLLDFYLYSAQAADRCFDRRSPGTGHVVPVSKPPAPPLLDTTERARTWTATELANLDAAARCAAGTGRPEYTISLVSALMQYFRVYGPWPQALALHQTAYDVALEVGYLPGQAAALIYMGVTQRQLGLQGQAAVTLARAVSLYHRLRDRRGRAAALLELGVVQRLTGASAEGEASLTEALTLYRELGERHGEAGACAELGALQRQTGNFEAAAGNLRQALGLFRGLGLSYGEAVTLAYLGSVQWITGELAEAEESLTGALGIYRARGEPIGEANNLLVLGGVRRDAGQLEQAGTDLAEALDIYRDVNDRRGLAGALALLGDVRRRTGDHDQAGSVLAQALGLFKEVDDPGGEAEALISYGALAAAAGAVNDARVRFERALDLARKIGSPKDEADALDGLAGTCADPQLARTMYQEALELYESMHCNADAQRVRQALAAREP
jgi:tetratricopeptide (TPR) repeat protein/transcriptional regulator with XRE-family HTH domain